ncbi:patatin-like phospholipase family protein [Ningiella sp. W23]|uniref:patatin-like phospholipase family protein n=1 Tax=Ningiella sp. W23 TaxID=3023715 RepID=UPI00375684B9
MQALSIYAGPKALATIQAHGVSPELFTAVLGASGGPKWFVLYGLDKVLFSEFMDNSSKNVDIIGSSIGAFRSVCFAQNDSAAAIDRLADSYSNTVYSVKPTVKEITDKGTVLLKHMLGDAGIADILGQPKKRVHIVVAKSHGLTAKEAKLKQGSGLLVAAARNALGRKRLQKSFTRVVFSSSDQGFSFEEKIPIITQQVQLNEENFVMSLQATGSIPLVIQGVPDIPGAGEGIYRDGGIIDYHFDIKIHTPGLVLYPHFYKTPIPGWFDKGLKRRSCHRDSYDNVLMLVPNEEFVASLPYAKIPDRKDFETMSAEQRIPYWHAVMEQSKRLGDEFLQWVNSDNPIAHVKPIVLKRN